MKLNTTHLVGYSMLGLSILIGGGSLLVYMVFLYVGMSNILDLAVGAEEALWIDFILCLMFFGQHSIMIRATFRRRIAHFIGPHYHGAFYSISSGVALLLLIIFWQKTGIAVVNFQGIARLSMHAMFWLSIAGFLWIVLSVKSFDVVGKNQIMDHIQQKQPATGPLTVTGPYLYIRHPLYFFLIMMLWGTPDISMDRLLFNSLWSIWIVAGTILEERDLVACFGKTYERYQQEVPMLIPRRILPKLYGHNTLKTKAKK